MWRHLVGRILDYDVSHDSWVAIDGWRGFEIGAVRQTRQRRRGSRRLKELGVSLYKVVEGLMNVVRAPMLIKDHPFIAEAKYWQRSLLVSFAYL